MVSYKTENSFTERFYLIYRGGRLAFSTGFFFIFLSFDSFHKLSFSKESLLVLAIYTFISLFLLIFSKRPTIFEFILDEIFIFVLVITDILNWNYFSIFFLFPIFFSALFLKKISGYAVTLLALTFYLSYYYVVIKFFNLSIALQIFLNSSAFAALMLAGQKLKKRLETQESYIQSLEEEKRQNEIYKRLYGISADLAHEIKNPLASIKGAVELLKEGKNNERLLDIIYNETVRLDSIVKDFLNLSRPILTVKSRVSIPVTIRKILKFMEIYNKKYKLNCDETLEVETNTKDLYTALESLIRNAFQWADSKVRISCSRRNNKIEIVVEDDGPGINEKEKIFEPFYSKHPNGSGLGLSIVKKFVIESGGKILVDRSSLGGAKFVVVLPIRGKG